MSSTKRPRLDPSHTVVFVHDLDVMISFYSEELGFEVADRGPVGSDEVAFLSTGLSHHQLAFVTGRTTTDKSNTIDHTAYKSSGDLDDLRELYERLSAHPAVTEIRPTTHGNTWSVYFQDPEKNGVEVYIETPWHVQQPQIRPLDLTRSNDEVHSYTLAEFEHEAGFEDIEQFTRRRAVALEGR